MTTKQTATINDWRLIRTVNGNFALQGQITDHARQGEFDPTKFQQTSSVILFDPVNKVAETLNTRYTLGKEFKEPEVEPVCDIRASSTTDDHVEAPYTPR